MEWYSQSVCYAPHPPPPNSFLLHGADPDEAISHEELALGYANRSAVLFQVRLESIARQTIGSPLHFFFFQMKEYDLCIRDITRALDHKYPNNLMYKLFERKARCHKALKDYPRALEAMKSAEMWMKHSTLSETKSGSFKKEISKQVREKCGYFRHYVLSTNSFYFHMVFCPVLFSRLNFWKKKWLPSLFLKSRRVPS